MPSSTLPPSASRLSPDQLRQLYRAGMEMGLPSDVVSEKVGQWQQRVGVTSVQEKKDDKTKVKRVKKQLPFWARFLTLVVPLACVGVGVLLVGNAVLPIAWYYVSTARDFNQALLAPVPREEVLESMPVVLSNPTSDTKYILGDSEDGGSGPVVIESELDYTNLANWFSTAALPQAVPTSTSAPGQVPSTPVDKAQEYTLDIPELNIANAHVRIGGTQLDKSLVQYPGTASPGDAGAPVIFGHSVLRQFYNPQEKNSRRYLSIFSTIMTLKKGSKIFLTADGVRYTYIVQEKQEVKPEDVYILEQHYDSRQLKLVTCVPEGTYLRRGVVIASLVGNE